MKRKTKQTIKQNKDSPLRADAANRNIKQIFICHFLDQKPKSNKNKKTLQYRKIIHQKT